MSQLDELKAKMAEAVKVFNATGDMSQIQAVSNEMNKAKAEIAKTEADRLLKEGEALAGKREALEAKLRPTIIALGLDKEIAAVKCKGFNYWINITYEIAGESIHNVQNLALVPIQVVRAKKTGGGGGATGKSKDEYGLSLQEIVDKFATAEELTAIAAATSNSKSWQLKVDVKKKAIATGKLAPVK